MYAFAHQVSSSDGAIVTEHYEGEQFLSNIIGRAEPA